MSLVRTRSTKYPHLCWRSAGEMYGKLIKRSTPAALQPIAIRGVYDDFKKGSLRRCSLLQRCGALDATTPASFKGVSEDRTTRRLQIEYASHLYDKVWPNFSAILSRIRTVATKANRRRRHNPYSHLQLSKSDTAVFRFHVVLLFAVIQV